MTGTEEIAWYAVFVDPRLFIFHLVAVFALGAIVGSYLNVCICRLPTGQSSFNPSRSFCFACGSPIRWYDNLPLVSYWALGARCRDCGAPFSIRYFMVELLTACLFACVFLVYRYNFSVIPLWVFTSLLIVATFTDFDNWIILDSVSLGGAVSGIVFAALAPLSGEGGGQWPVSQSGPLAGGVWYGPVGNAVIGAAFGYGLLWAVGWLGRLLFRKEAMGGGDLRLFACVGAYLGWLDCLRVMFLASVIGSALGGLMIVIARVRSAGRDRELESSGGFHHLPFGPHIALASWLIMIAQPRLAEIEERFLDAVGRLLYGG